MKMFSLLAVIGSVLTLELFAGSGHTLHVQTLTGTIGGAGPDCFVPTFQLPSVKCIDCLPTNNGGTFGSCGYRIEEKCEEVTMGGYQWQNECFDRNLFCGGNLTIYDEPTCAMEGFYPPTACLRSYPSAYEFGTKSLIDCGVEL